MPNSPLEFVDEVEQFIEISKDGKLDIGQVRFTNVSESPVEIIWNTTKCDLPEGWDYSMCAYGKCQIGVPEKGNLTVKPGAVGFIAIHVLPKGKEGAGTVEFLLSNAITSNELASIKFHVTCE